jgi:hypothetical protein
LRERYGAKAYKILEALRDAEAPLFHGGMRACAGEQRVPSAPLRAGSRLRNDKALRTRARVANASVAAAKQRRIPNHPAGGRLGLLQNHAPDEIGKPGDSAVFAPTAEFIDDFLGGTGIPVASGADLHGGGAGEQEFNYVGGS